MDQFPVTQLRPQNAELEEGVGGTAALTVTFDAFLVPSGADGADPLAFDSPLRADGINLPTLDLAQLQGQTFAFPVNPDDGFIDASVYFCWAHNPVDITRLSFGPLKDGQVMLTVVSRWIMTFEQTGFEDFDLTFTVPLHG